MENTESGTETSSISRVFGLRPQSIRALCDFPPPGLPPPSLVRCRRRHHESGRDTWCHRRERVGTTSDERGNGNNKQTNQCGHIAVSRLQSHPLFSILFSVYFLSLSSSSVPFLSLLALLLRCGARARYMGGKKRPEKSIRSARKDGICVSAVGDQRIGSSRSAGVSLGHARSESHSSGARSSVPPRPAAPEFASSAPGPACPSTFHLPVSRYVAEACIVQADTPRSRAVPVPFTERGLMDSL